MRRTNFKYAIPIGRLFCLILLLVFAACTQDPWTEKEKESAMDECMAEADDKSYCNCYVNKLMDKYPYAEEADNISFEEAVEIEDECD